MLAAAAAMTFGAAYVRGLTGFGMAIILVPLLGLIVTPAEAVVLGILLQVLIGPVGIKIIYADAHRKSALSIAAYAVMATPLGIWLLQQTTPDAARLLIDGVCRHAGAAGCAILSAPTHSPGRSAGVDDARLFRHGDSRDHFIPGAWSGQLAAAVAIIDIVSPNAGRQLAGGEIFRHDTSAYLASVCRTNIGIGRDFCCIQAVLTAAAWARLTPCLSLFSWR